MKPLDRPVVLAPTSSRTNLLAAAAVIDRNYALAVANRAHTEYVAAVDARNALLAAYVEYIGDEADVTAAADSADAAYLVAQDAFDVAYLAAKNVYDLWLARQRILHETP